LRLFADFAVAMSLRMSLAAAYFREFQVRESPEPAQKVSTGVDQAQARPDHPRANLECVRTVGVGEDDRFDPRAIEIYAGKGVGLGVEAVMTAITDAGDADAARLFKGLSATTARVHVAPQPPTPSEGPDKASLFSPLPNSAQLGFETKSGINLFQNGGVSIRRYLLILNIT
jgi:hypothetical protein